MNEEISKARFDRIDDVHGKIFSTRRERQAAEHAPDRGGSLKRTTSSGSRCWRKANEARKGWSSNIIIAAIAATFGAVAKYIRLLQETMKLASSAAQYVDLCSSSAGAGSPPGRREIVDAATVQASAVASAAATSRSTTSLIAQGKTAERRRLRPRRRRTPARPRAPSPACLRTRPRTHSPTEAGNRRRGGPRDPLLPRDSGDLLKKTCVGGKV